MEDVVTVVRHVWVGLGVGDAVFDMARFALFGAAWWGLVRVLRS